MKQKYFSSKIVLLKNVQCTKIRSDELLVRGYNVDVGVVDVFAKNSEGNRVHKQLEVDFVVNYGSQRYFCQYIIQYFYDCKKGNFNKNP